MTLKLTEEKKQKIYDLCTKLFEKSKPTMWFASFPAVPLGPLFYRALETDKIVGLKGHRQNYDDEIELFSEAYSELVWWKHNIKDTCQDLVIPKPDITIFTDATGTGWSIADGHNSSGGQWAEHERTNINVLELKAAFIGIRTYCHKRSYTHIRFLSDSSKAIAYINNRRGIKSKKMQWTCKRNMVMMLKIFLLSLQLTCQKKPQYWSRQVS